MRQRSISRSKRAVALLFSVGLVVAACGSDDDESADTEADTEAEAEPEEESSDDGAADDESDDGAMDEEESDDGAMDEEESDDGAMDEEESDDGGEASGEANAIWGGPPAEPVAAEGDPIKIGVQNLEGDPAGSFPEYSAAVQAAADYINAELGGLGGREIEIDLCPSIVTPDDSQRCANELAAEGVDMVLSTINFFGNHIGIYQGAGIPVVVGTPITIADFTSPGVFSIGAGGGCFGVHTGLVDFATDGIEELEGLDVQRVGVPWADTPPGVVCYNDLEAKPLDVINGSEPGDSDRAGTKPDLEHVGVPIAPATPDVTPQATEVLDFDPDVIIFSAQGADCWNFVDALGRLGWTPDDIPLVLSGACTDFDALAATGDLGVGIYLTGTANGLFTPADVLPDGEHKTYVTTYNEKAPEYGLDPSLQFTGFATQGWSSMMAIWQFAQGIDGDITGESIAEAFATSDGSTPTYGAAPLDCAGASAPYVSVCSRDISIQQWDGAVLNTLIDSLDGSGLVAGTELRPG
ncbi:MAG: ABC transporter substrate-binding protein [Actinomycetota bacterium]